MVAFEANRYVHRKFAAATDYAARGVDYRHQALASEPGEVTFLVITDSASLADDRVEGHNSLLRRTGEGRLDHHRLQPAPSLFLVSFATAAPLAGVQILLGLGVVFAGAAELPQFPVPVRSRCGPCSWPPRR